MLISLCLINMACRKDIEFDEEEIETRIVVNGIFSENDSLLIHLSESRNVLFYDEGNLPFLSKAQVKLIDGNDNTLGLFSYLSEGQYYLPLTSLEAGQYYKLRISNPGFEDILAESVLPEAISITNIDTIRKKRNMDFQVSFKDDPLEINYYSLSVIATSYTTIELEPGVFETKKWENGWSCTKDNINQSGSIDRNGEFCSSIFLFNDETFNGSNYTFILNKYIDETTDTVFVELRNMSEAYFKYRVSYEKYFQNIINNPFAEPVQVYSNIENGFGIFGGYSSDRKTIIL
jgi:hypothetical protein